MSRFRRLARTLARGLARAVGRPDSGITTPQTYSDYDTTDFGAYMTTDAGNYQVID